MTKRYKCTHCGREFHARIAHKCNGTFRKKLFSWEELPQKKEINVKINEDLKDKIAKIRCELYYDIPFGRALLYGGIKENEIRAKRYEKFETMKKKEKQKTPKFKKGDYVATRDGKVGIITKNGLWCFDEDNYIYPFDRYASDVQIEAMDDNLKEDGKYFNKETFTIENIIPKPKFKVGDKVRFKREGGENDELDNKEFIVTDLKYIYFGDSVMINLRDIDLGELIWGNVEYLELIKDKPLSESAIRLFKALAGGLMDGYEEEAQSTQIGGNHYKDMAIQPMEFALKNGLNYAESNVVKYICRHRKKNGKEDLLKAIHNIELLIEHEYGDK